MHSKWRSPGGSERMQSRDCKTRGHVPLVCVALPPRLLCRPEWSENTLDSALLQIRYILSTALVSTSPCIVAARLLLRDLDHCLPRVVALQHRNEQVSDLLQPLLDFLPELDLARGDPLGNLLVERVQVLVLDAGDDEAVNVERFAEDDVPVLSYAVSAYNGAV